MFQRLLLLLARSKNFQCDQIGVNNSIRVNSYFFI